MASARRSLQCDYASPRDVYLFINPRSQIPKYIKCLSIFRELFLATNSIQEQRDSKKKNKKKSFVSKFINSYSPLFPDIPIPDFFFFFYFCSRVINKTQPPSLTFDLPIFAWVRRHYFCWLPEAVQIIQNIQGPILAHARRATWTGRPVNL